ncbi:MAG: site-2 protease family protein [Mogibacterium sp.]|nr:site-2 protease family protein [Mogibacterium sp.]
MGDMFLTKLLMLPGIIIGLTFHEAAHAFASYKLGDPTPKQQGRLSINPIAHIDVIGFICLLVCGFGWGKPVQINPYYYKHRRRDEFIVAIAGVTLNFIIAIIAGFVTGLVYRSYYLTGSGLMENLFYIFYYTVSINLVLMVFNLLPCPPLDGWGILSQIFNLEKYSWYPNAYKYGSIVLLILVVTNGTSLILTPVLNVLMNFIFGIFI